MDDSPNLEQRPGGTVTPMIRPASGRQPDKTRPEATAERFELRDPFAEGTHRASTFNQMVSTAERVGAIRFTAVAPDGKRTQVFKVDGQWIRGDRDTRPNAPIKEEGHRSANVVPLVATASAEAAVALTDTDHERKARAAQIEAVLSERYLIKRTPLRLGSVEIGQTEYRHRGDTSRVAFTETSLKLSTDTNSPSVARSMVDVAEARGWQALRVSGHEDFKRLVWLEASLRGVRAVGYEPVPGDQQLLRKEREARQVNRVEPVPVQPADPTGTAKASSRGSGSRKAVLAAVEAVLLSRRVPEKQREAVMTAVEANLARRTRNGETFRVKVYDKDAPSQRAAPVPTREQQRGREQTPTR